MNGVKFLIVVIAASLAAFAGAAGAIFYLDAKKEQTRIAASEQEILEQAQQERLRPVSPKEAFISQCTYENSTFEGRVPEVLCELTWGNIAAAPMDASEITRDTVHVDSRYMECINKWSEATREECLKAASDPDKPWTDDYQERMTERCLRTIDRNKEGQIKYSVVWPTMDSVIEYFNLLPRKTLIKEYNGLMKQLRMKEKTRCSSKDNMEEYLDLYARTNLARAAVVKIGQ